MSEVELTVALSHPQDPESQKHVRDPSYNSFLTLVSVPVSVSVGFSVGHLHKT